MRFAHVTGTLHTEPTGYRIEVTLDTRTRVATVRNEAVPRLMMRDGMADADWTVDQLTQETIGTTLAEQGWEAISSTTVDFRESWGPPTVVYFVRG
jgi:hypothetical protein